MKSKPDLSVEFAGIKMKNPIMTASGTSGYGEELEGFYDPSILGAIVSKGITLSPRDGNPQPRIFETPCGMINRIGLENKGMDYFINHQLPKMGKYGIPVIVNISGFHLDEFAQMTKVLGLLPQVAALEINVSCPNVHGGNLPFGSTSGSVAEVVGFCKKETNKPLIVKLTPNVTNIVEIAQAAKLAGADVISLVNTFLAGFIHQGKLYMGGQSGAAIKNMALLKVAQVAQNVDIPVIGMGGITTVQDVVDFISVGAFAVAVGTSTFGNPILIPELIQGLEDYCEMNQKEDLDQIRGTVKFA